MEASARLRRPDPRPTGTDSLWHFTLRVSVPQLRHKSNLPDNLPHFAGFRSPPWGVLGYGDYGSGSRNQQHKHTVHTKKSNCPCRPASQRRECLQLCPAHHKRQMARIVTNMDVQGPSSSKSATLPASAASGASRSKHRARCTMCCTCKKHGRHGVMILTSFSKLQIADLPPLSTACMYTESRTSAAT